MQGYFKSRYKDEICPKFLKDFGKSNIFQVPRLEKIVLNMGVGRIAQDKKHLASAVESMAVIAGQKPVVCLAKKAVAGFKIREGFPVGVKTTLRGRLMYAFLERLIVVAMPRISDFLGVSKKSMNGVRSMTIGIEDISIFPEIDYDKVLNRLGMDITIVTNAQKQEEMQAVLEGFDFPFKKDASPRSSGGESVVIKEGDHRGQ